MILLNICFVSVSNIYKMATVIPDQIAADKVMSKDDAEYAVDEKSDTFRPSAPLGKPIDEKKFWFQRTKKSSYDPHAIATLV